MDLVISAGVPLSVIIQKNLNSLSIFNMLFIFDCSMSCNSCRGPVRQEQGITSQNKNVSGIEQLSVLSFYKIQMSLSERAVPSGDSSSSLLSNADYPPPPPPLRNHKLRGSWWNPKHETLTGLSNPCLNLRRSSLLTLCLTQVLPTDFFFNFKCQQLQPQNWHNDHDFSARCRNILLHNLRNRFQI